MRWDLFPRFEDALREHINREDNGLFPAAAIHLGGPEWDEVERLTPPHGVGAVRPRA